MAAGLAVYQPYAPQECAEFDDEVSRQDHVDDGFLQNSPRCSRMTTTQRCTVFLSLVQQLHMLIV